MRRITTGQTGDPLLGQLVIEDRQFSPLSNTDSLQLSGSTVEVDVDLDIRGGNSLRVYNGSNYVDVNAPGLSSNVNFTLPDSTGSTGDVLRTDGSGNLSFQDVSFDVNNQTADTDTYYPLMSTSSSGEITGVTTTTGKLEFQPSSGTLTVDSLSSDDVDIGGGSIDGTTIGANTAAAGTFTEITETSSVVLKQDIQPLTNVIDKLADLNGVSYTRIQTGNSEVGLIAEEVEKIIPEIVNINGEYKSISYSRLTAYLIEAVKTLKSELDTLKNGNP